MCTAHQGPCSSQSRQRAFAMRSRLAPAFAGTVAVAESLPSVGYSLNASPSAEVGVVTFVWAAVEVRYPSWGDEQGCRVNDLAFGFGFGEGVCAQVSPIEAAHLAVGHTRSVEPGHSLRWAAAAAARDAERIRRRALIPRARRGWFWPGRAGRRRVVLTGRAALRHRRQRRRRWKV